MRVALFGLLGVASVVRANTAPSTWDASNSTIPIPRPTRPLEWGDVNVLHTTDIHGWISGHTKVVYPEKSWSGTFGDFYSFVKHMRDIAEQRHSDLLLVDTGDRRIGHGLTDHVLNGVNGQNVSLLYRDMGYDLVVPGNHDLKNPHVVNFTMNTLTKLWGHKYLTSNVNRKDGTPLGARHRRWVTSTGTRMMAFGVVPIKTAPPPDYLEVIGIDKMVNESWFLDSIKPDPQQPVDVFVLLGHVDPKKPTKQDDIKLIYKAIRQKHPYTPVMIFAGHTHQRWCTTIKDENNATRSMLLQSGRYFDTVGWMSVKLDNNSVAQNLTFSRRYLDNNVPTYMYHTGIDNETEFHTRPGKLMTKRIREVENSEALTKVYGYLKSDYYLDREEWTEEEKDPNSLFSFYLNAVQTSLVDPKKSRHWLFLSNWGILRGDIYKGNFTRSDLYAISPDDRTPFLYTTVPRHIADQIVNKTQTAKPPRQPKSVTLQASQPETLDTFNDGTQSHFSLPSGSSDGLTYGWVTSDECGDGGDDVVHEKIPKLDFDNPKSGVPIFFWRKNYKPEDLKENDDVDIIATNYIGNKNVLEALKQLGVAEPKLYPYREDVRQDNLLTTYIEKTFPYKAPPPGKHNA